MNQNPDPTDPSDLPDPSASAWAAAGTPDPAGAAEPMPSRFEPPPDWPAPADPIAVTPLANGGAPPMGGGPSGFGAASPAPDTASGGAPPMGGGPSGFGAAPPDPWFDAPAGGGGPDGPGRARRSARTWVLGGVGAVAIVAAAAFGINAAGTSSSSSSSASTGGTGTSASAGRLPGGGGIGTRGTITTVDGSTLTVKTSSGSVKVTTSSSTTVAEASTGTASDIAVGDHISVMGTTSGTKVTATQVVDQGTVAFSTTTGGFGGPGGAPPTGSGSSSSARPSGTPPNGAGAGGGRPVSGTVTKVSGSTLTLKGTDGTTYTLTLGSSAKVVVEKAATVSALKTGETVSVMGTTTSGTVKATRIVEGTVSLGGR